MEPIVSMTALQRNPKGVKEKAKNGIVRVTDQGSGGYVFCSEAALEELISKERADAAYEARLMDAVGRGQADIDAGRFYSSVDDAFEAAELLRNNRA